MPLTQVETAAWAAKAKIRDLVGRKPEPRKTRKCRRAENKMSLLDAMASAMQGEEKVSVKEAIEAILAAV